MIMRTLTTLSLATIFFASALLAQDTAAKKAKKADRACCADKAEAKGTDGKAMTMTQKDRSRSCCDMEKSAMSGKKEAHKMDCCAEHAKEAGSKQIDSKPADFEKDMK